MRKGFMGAMIPLPRQPVSGSAATRGRARGEDHGAFDDVLQLADVAGPGVVGEEAERAAVEARDGAALLLGDLAAEEVGEDRDVVGALFTGGAKLWSGTQRTQRR